MNRLLVLMASMVVMAGSGLAANAQLPVVFDENYYPTNPTNTFGAFTFNDFSGVGAFTDGPNSIILDVQDSDGSNGVFGGVGVDYGTPPGTNNVNFDPTTSRVELNIKILPNNAATAIRTTYIDHDGGFPVAAEEYVFEFNLANVPNDGQFHLLSQAANAPLFNQSAFNFDANDDGINNPGLRQMQIQSVFGSTGRLNVEIDFLRIVVPEPTALVLVGMALSSLAVWRKRAG